MATEQTINLNVTGVTYFRNQLTKIPSKVSTLTVTRRGSTPSAAQAAAKEAAFYAVCDAIRGWTPSYSYVTSGFGSYNTIDGNAIGVSYHRTSVDGVVVTNNTSTPGVEDTGVGGYVSTGRATGTGEGQKVWRNTYSALIKLSLESGVSPTSGAITKALINLTPTSITGSPSNYTWRLAIANNGSVPSSFIRPDTIENSDYTYKDFQFSSSSGATEIEITELVQKMVEKSSYYLYLCCTSIPGSNTSFSITSTSTTLSVKYELSRVVTNEEFKGDEIVESQKKILTPYQQFTLSWGGASNGLGTTVSGYELYYMDANNNKQIIGTYGVDKLSVELKPDKEGGINPYLPPRGSTRTFYLRALANYSAADLQGEAKSYSITTNSLPTSPSFSLSAGYYKNSEEKWVEDQTIYGEDIQNNIKYYWFKSGEDNYSYDLEFNFPLSNDKDSESGQRISYTYEVDGDIVDINDQTFSNEAHEKLPVGEAEDERWQKTYKITATDTLGESSSTELIIYRSLPITITKSDLSAPYQDVEGNGYWIYFSDTPLITGGYENKYTKTLTLNDTELKGITEINNILILRKDVKSSVSLKLTVTDGVDTASCTYDFNVPVAALFEMFNAPNEQLAGVNSNYFGNFIAFKTKPKDNEIDRVDKGVTITTTIGETKFSFSKQPLDNPTYQYCEPSVKELTRNESHTFVIEQRWGDYVHTTETPYFRCIGEEQLLSGLSVYQSGVFYPLILGDNKTPESFGIIDSDKITAPKGLENSTSLMFQNLPDNPVFCQAAALSTKLEDVLRIEIKQKENPKETLILKPQTEGAHVTLSNLTENEFFEFVTWSSENLVDWPKYFDIKDAKPIPATATVIVTNLFGEEFLQELDFNISFQTNLLKATHKDILIKLVNESYQTIKIEEDTYPSVFPIFEGETFKFSFSATSPYQQDIKAHVKIMGKELERSLTAGASASNGTTEYTGEIEFLIPQILNQLDGAEPEVWLSAPGVTTNLNFEQSVVFNPQRSNINASDLTIMDILAEKLNEVDPLYQGAEYLNAYRYTVSLKGTDFGGENSYQSFAGNPIYTVYFSQDQAFVNGVQKVIEYDQISYPDLRFSFETNYETPPEGTNPTVAYLEGTLLALTASLRQGYIKIDYQFENNFEKDTSFSADPGTIAGERVYSKTLGIIAVFALKPTVFYGANRLGFNTDKFSYSDSILEILNKDGEKNKVYLKNISSDSVENLLMIDLQTGESHGFIFLGTNWDDGSDSDYTVPTPAEGKEF